MRGWTAFGVEVALATSFLLASAAIGLGADRASIPGPPKLKPLETIENSIGMKLVLIPAGNFDVGSPLSEEGRDSDEALHHVRLTRDFFLGQTEVTVGQFRQFVNDRGYKTEAETNRKGGMGYNGAADSMVATGRTYNWRHTGFAQTDDHPVVNVTWNDAQAFLRWLSEKERTAYRLPTEAEWEYACRGGTSTAYSCGDDPEILARIGNVADGTARARLLHNKPTINGEDGFVFTAPVGRFQANAFKLFDMHGNVSEWCEDRYGDYPTRAAIDPAGPDPGAGRVIRGGGWADYASRCRAAYRARYSPSTVCFFFGFRAVRAR